MSADNCTSHDTRLRSVTAKLIASLRTDTSVTIQIFYSSELSAFSRSDGQISISSALLAQLSDEELAAVIAHELGHLLNHGDVHSLWALAGSGASDDEESAADRTALQVLRATQRDPSALQSMLVKVAADSALSPLARQRIARRIARLKSVADTN